MPELHLYGVPAVHLDGAGVVPLAAREAALLAWLHLEGPTSRAALAGRLWPAGGEAKARANLRQTLVRLKRSAGELLEQNEGPLRLAAGVRVAAPGQAPGGARLLGSLEFDDAPELADWLQARRDAARRERQRGLLAEAQRHLQAGASAAALAAADTVLDDDAAVEEAHRLRMQALWLRGDRAAAIAAWDDCRLALRAAFGVAPSEATQALGRALLADVPPESLPPARAPLPSAALGSAFPAALRHPPRLVGRQNELHSLLQARALGHHVVLSGPGGVGKSRLLAQLLGADAAALVIAARAGDSLLPGALAARALAAALERFAPALDAATRAALAPLLPGGAERAPARRPQPDADARGTADATDAAAAVTTAQQHRRQRAALASAFAKCCARGLHVVAIDDLQHADEDSVAALQGLAGEWRVQPEAPALWLAARTDELGSAGRGLLEALAAGGRCLRAGVGPLEVADVRALLAELPGASEPAADHATLACALHAQVGGNPAFVLESLKTLWLAGPWQPGHALPLPATLVEAQRQRLLRLPNEALQLAQLAAVARTDFSIALAAAALGKTTLQLAPLWSTLEAAQVFDGLGLGHELMAEAVLTTLPEPLRPPLHRWVAEHLQAQAVQPAQAGAAAARIAHHLAQAADPAAAAAWHRRAAEHARARWQMTEAARSFEAAARAFETTHQPALAFAAWRDAARCRLNRSQHDEAATDLEHAAVHAQGEQDALLLAATRVTWLYNSGRMREAAEVAKELTQALPRVGLARAGPSLDDAELGQTLLSCVLSAPYVAEPESLLALCVALRPRIAGASATAPRGPLAMRLALAEGMTLNFLGRPREALVTLGRARTLAEAAGDSGEQVNIGNQLLRAHEALGELDAALAECVRTRALAEAADFGPGFAADLLGTEGLLCVTLGEVERGLACFHQARARLGGGAAQGYLALRQASAWLHLGRTDEAESLMRSLPDARAERSPLAAYGAWNWVRIAHARGEAADPWLAHARSCCPNPGTLNGLRAQVMSLRYAGAPGAALGATQAAGMPPWLPLLHERGLRTLARSAHIGVAALALARGELAEAASQARQALALAGCPDAWIEPPQQLVQDANRILAAAG